MYIPAFWWEMVDSGKGEGAAVVFEYQTGSDFVRNIFEGIE